MIPVVVACLQASLALPLVAAERAARCRLERLVPRLVRPGFRNDRLLCRKDNAAIRASGEPVDIVFMGDSITEGWHDKRPGFFKRGRIDRGIGGQTSSQMVLRMYSDVIALKPKAVHIMGGTNDIAGNTGPMTAQMTHDNVRAMTDIARRHDIKVLIACIPPAAFFPWRTEVETRPRIADLNRRLERFAREIGSTWVDYGRVLDDGTGAMKAWFRLGRRSSYRGGI